MISSAEPQLAFGFETDKEFSARLVPRLIPIAQRIAAAAADRRVTVADLRHAAVKAGVLTGDEQGKRLSFLHEVFPKAGFEKTEQYRRSDIPKAHHNLNLVWYLPEPVPHP